MVPKERRKKLKLLGINSEQEIPEPKERTALDSTLLPAEKGVEFCNRLFFPERMYKKLSSDDRKSMRLKQEIPIWEEFWGWLDTLNPTGGSKLEKAINYARNHHETLMNYMLDDRCEISNNLCEANIKPYAMARRAWLFADTLKGATANAVLYTLVESAKANDLDVYEYLKYLLNEIPNRDFNNHPEILDHFLSWSTELPDECRLNHNHKKCFKK